MEADHTNRARRQGGVDSTERRASADRDEVLDQADALKAAPELLTQIDLSGKSGEVESFYIFTNRNYRSHPSPF